MIHVMIDGMCLGFIGSMYIVVSVTFILNMCRLQNFLHFFHFKEFIT